MPGYEYVAEAELISMCMKEKKTMKATVDGVLRHRQKIESHGVFEAHLPQLIPLLYIEEIYMAETIFHLGKLIGDSIPLVTTIILEFVVNINLRLIRF